MTEDNKELANLTAMVVSAYVAHNNLPASELSDLIASTHEALGNLGAEAQVPVSAPVPAVAIRKSITPDAIICLEDGLAFKTLKRHLSTKYGMTPEQYRAKWGLPSDYPMVAPGYAEKRSALAKTMGLGRKAAGSSDTSDEAPAVKPSRGKRAAKVQTEG